MDINAIETKVVSFLVDKGFDIIGAIIILVIGAFFARWLGQFVNKWLEKYRLEPPVNLLIVR